MTFQIPDGREKFYQWDLDQRLRCVGVDAGAEIHFSTPLEDERDALVVYSYEEDGAVWADVPNELLQCGGVCTVYAYPRSGGEGHTACAGTFSIVSREKPEDYVYTGEEIRRWETLEARLAELEESGVSPVISVEEISGGHRVTITDGEGTQSFDVMDGTAASGDGVTVDATLTQEGQAADAAAVGAVIAEAGAAFSELSAALEQNAAATARNTADIEALTAACGALTGLPEVTADDNDKLLQVVDGTWQTVALADSAIADYIDNYINEALGGEY